MPILRTTKEYVEDLYNDIAVFEIVDVVHLLNMNNVQQLIATMVNIELSIRYGRDGYSNFYEAFNGQLSVPGGPLGVMTNSDRALIHETISGIRDCKSYSNFMGITIPLIGESRHYRGQAVGIWIKRTCVLIDL